jgi:hypothetical protein
MPYKPVTAAATNMQKVMICSPDEMRLKPKPRTAMRNAKRMKFVDFVVINVLSW